MAVFAAGGSTRRSSSPAWWSWGSPGPTSSAGRLAHSPTPPSLHRQGGGAQRSGGRGFSLSAERAKVRRTGLNKPKGCVSDSLFRLCFPFFFHFLTLYFTVCQCQSHAASSSPRSDTSQTQQPHKDGVTGNRFANCSLTSRKSGSEATKNHTSLHRTQKRNYSCNN